MRQIKFRGKRADNGEWVYGDYCSQDADHVALIGVWSTMTRSCDWIPVHEDTVGQFTGLLDKAGKEIWEGDVLRLTTPSDDYYRIDKSVENVGVLFKNSMWCFGRWHMSATYYFGKLNNQQFEIIGNIHDNPDLLTTPQWDKLKV